MSLSSVLSQVESYLSRSRQAYSGMWVTTVSLHVKHTASASRGHLLWFLRQTKDFPYRRNPKFINVMPADTAFKIKIASSTLPAATAAIAQHNPHECWWV